MRMTLLFLFLLVFYVQAEQSYSQVTKISLDMEDSSVEKILQSIEEKSEFYFLYNSKLVNVDRITDIHVNEKSIASVLTQLFDTNEVEFEVKGTQIILSPKQMHGQLIAVTEAFQQQKRTITGTIADAAGLPIIGANIVEVGTTNGTVTDVDGKFSLSVANNATIRITYIGYLEQDVSTIGRTAFNITLEEDTRALDELVVIGYGSMRKSDLTGAVTSVSKKNIDKPVTNVLQSIQGSVPGVTITQNSSIPHDSPSIYIRGLNSISANNSPLIIIDGMPGDLNIVNPNDIESITILKDASSTAIYGSRASNGVIIVSTKRGEGVPTVNFNSFYGIRQPSKYLNFMKPEKYLFYRQKFAEHAGFPSMPENVLRSEEERLNYAAGITTDWQDLIFKNATFSENNLSISGGEKSLNYFVSANYREYDHIAGNYNNDQKSVRSNIGKDFHKWLKIENELTITQSKRSGSTGDFWNVSLLNPYTSPEDPDGNLYIWPLESYTTYLENPLNFKNSISNNDKIDINERISINLTLPVEGLNYQTHYGINWIRDKYNGYDNKNTSRGYNNEGYAYKNTGASNYWIFENMVNYKNSFKKHTFFFTGLYSAEESKHENLNADAYGFVNDILEYNYLSAGSNYNPPYSYGERWALTSLMARLNYNYDEKYLLTMTVRKDGYSAFGKNKKYGTFPSIGLAWRIEQESFMENVPLVSQLKLRLSYGKNGNQAIPSYSSHAKIETSIPYSFGESTNVIYGFLPVSIANENLGWETTKSSNFGLDFGLIKNKITGSIDYYHSSTSDILLTRGIPFTSGFGSIYDNIGRTQNDGIEFSLNTINFDNKEGFSWTSHFNLSYNKNQIVDLYGDKKDDLGNGWFIGKPINVYFDYVFDGIWQESDDIAKSVMPSAKPGEAKLKDISGPDGTPDGIIDPNDRQIIGKVNPDFTWGFTNYFQYKNFDLSFILQGVLGTTGYAALLAAPIGNEYIAILDLDYWLPEAPSNRFPSGIRDRSLSYVSSAFYYDRDYLRLKDVTFGYTFPNTLLQKIKVNRLRIYLNATNLLTITDWPLYDPETTFSRARGLLDSPMVKSFTAGLDISF